MKKSVIILSSLLAVGTGFTVFTTGCAGTRTSESTGEYIDDAGITTKVKAEFVRDPVVSAMGIKVETYKGVVQLSGFAKNQQEKNRAEQIARIVPGVQSVQNNISIK